MSSTRIENNKLAKNVVFVYTRVIVITLLGLLFTRFSLQALGQSDFGLFNVVGGIVSVLNILSTAMSTTTRRFINIEMGKFNGNLNKIFNICLLTNCFFAVLLFLLSESIGLLYIYNFLNVQPDKFSNALIIFHISTATAALAIINVPYQSLLAANERFAQLAVIDIITNVVKLLGVALIFFVSFDRLIFYAVIMCLTTIASLFAYSQYCKRKWPIVVRKRLYKDKVIYKQILTFNNYIALGASSYVVRTQGSNMIINYFFGTVVNGIFSIASMFESYAMIIISNLTSAAAPQIVKNYSKGDIDYAFNIACRINRYSVLFMATIVFVTLSELPFILKMWLGYLPEGCLELCQWTLISAMVRSLTEGLPPFIQASGSIKWFQIIGSINQWIVLPLACLLFYLGFDVVYIIICFVITSFTNTVITLLLMARLISTEHIKRFITQSFVSSAIVGLFFVFYLLLHNLLMQGISPFFNILISLIYSCIIIYVFGLKQPERELIHTFIKNIISPK